MAEPLAQFSQALKSQWHKVLTFPNGDGLFGIVGFGFFVFSRVCKSWGRYQAINQTFSRKANWHDSNQKKKKRIIAIILWDCSHSLLSRFLNNKNEWKGHACILTKKKYKGGSGHRIFKVPCVSKDFNWRRRCTTLNDYIAIVKRRRTVLTFI